MKKNLFWGIALTMALASCSNEELATGENGQSSLKAVVETGVDSRVGFDKENGWAFFWHNSDQIWVNGSPMTTKADNKPSTAQFTGWGVNTTSGYAVYPYSIADGNVSNNILTMNFPATYEYKAWSGEFFKTTEEIPAIPMAATVSNETAYFKHLGALFIIKFNDWDEIGDHVFTLTASKQITGNFTADLTTKEPQFTATEGEGSNTVSISFTRAEGAEAEDLVFYIPVPTGNYDVTLAMKVGGQVIFQNTKNKGVDRAKFIYANLSKSGLQAGSSSEDKLITALAAGGTVTLEEDITLTKALTVPEDVEVILNLNGKTITGPSEAKDADGNRIHAFVNNGILTIKGGTVKSAADNGGSAIYNAVGATLVIDENTTVLGAPKTDGGWPSYAINNYGNLTVNSITVKSYHGGIATCGNGTTVINDAKVDVGQNAVTGITSYTLYTEGTAKLTVNGGTFANTATDAKSTGGAIVCEDGDNAVEINGGSFSGGCGLYGDYVITSGTFDIDVTKWVAEGYTATQNANGAYEVVKGATVKNAAEFIAAINDIEDGDVILLSANVNFTTENRTNYSDSWYEGIYYTGDKSFTIDLAGKQITNSDNAVNDYMLLFKNDGTKESTITIKNGTIDAGTTAYCAICTSTGSTQKITINLEKVELINDNSYGATAKIRGGAVLNVKDGTKITGKDSYSCMEIVASTANIYDGVELYQNGTSSYVGSLIGVSYSGIVNVYGGKGVSKKSGLAVYTSGGTINAMGGEWTANNDGTVTDSNNSVLLVQNDKNTYPNAGNSVVNVTGGTYKGGYNCYGNAVGDAQLVISGGTFNANPTSYLESGKTATESNGTWIVQ